MTSLSPQQIIAYLLGASVLYAVIHILFITPPCGGNYHIAIGGDEYLLFKCDNAPNCENVTCQDGQHCVDGNCVQNADPCKEVNCLNGGTCQFGKCNCPDGYTGTLCGERESNSVVWTGKRGSIEIKNGYIGTTGSTWTSDAMSKNYLPGNNPGKIVHVINNVAGQYALGFNKQRSSTAPDDLDYGLQFMQEAGNRLAVYDPISKATVKTVYLGDVVTIERLDDGAVVFLQNGVKFHRMSGNIDDCLFMDLKVKNIRLEVKSITLDGGWLVGQKNGCL